MTEAPVLVTVVPASTAKDVAVPSPTGAWAAHAARIPTTPPRSTIPATIVTAAQRRRRPVEPASASCAMDTSCTNSTLQARNRRYRSRRGQVRYLTGCWQGPADSGGMTGAREQATPYISGLGAPRAAGRGGGQRLARRHGAAGRRV